jgi:DNA mismatch endonuclease (patch repair protein)
MSLIKSKGNRNTELRLISIFRAHRITGWRRNYPLPGKPDFVFPRAKFAVFVDGCFWHGCKRHCRLPKSRTEFWHPKIARNQARDRKVKRLINERGWKVIRIWEHALSEPHRIACRVQAMLASVEQKD